MAGLSFTHQVKRDMDKIKSEMSNLVTKAAKEAWKVAVDNTPVLTGTLRQGWKLSNQRRGSYVPRQRYDRSRPPVPNFRFRITIDKRVYLFNNVPYASYVDNGEGPGSRVPRMMMRRAILRFESVLASGR